MDLIIIFFGLIAHVNQPFFSLDNTAVLPADPYHVAEMIVPAAAIANPDDPWVKEVCESGDPCVIPLQGYNVEVAGTRGLFSRMSDELQHALPSLTTLAPKCGGLRREVRKRQPGDKEFASFIDYRGGRRALEKTFNTKASFPDAPPWDTERCLACQMRYAAEVDGDYARFIFTPHGGGSPAELRIKKAEKGKDYTVFVRHLPPPERRDDAARHSHFNLYYRIYERRNCDPAEVNVSHERCTEPICRYDDGPFPQADCTQTGHP